MSAVEDREGKIDLAGEPEFRLGALTMRPSTCQVLSSAGEERVEPRMMEVLVVLHRALGQTVTRDQLIEACWDRRVVSDDAVNRIIAKVRQLSRGAEPPHFTVDTVPKVGFRLLAATGLPEEKADSAEDAVSAEGVIPQARRALARVTGSRAALAIAVAATVGLAATLAWLAQPANRGTNGQVALSSFAAIGADPRTDRLAARLPGTLQKILAGSGVLTAASGDADAEFFVTGAIEKEGDKDAIRGSVVKRSSGQAIWSGRMVRRIDEPAGLEQEFSAKLASILLCAMEERKAAKKALSDQVLSLLLYACDGDADIAAKHRLVEKADDLAGAHALLALGLASQSEMALHSPKDAALLAAQANASIARALGLDPNHATAHAVRGIPFGARPLSLAERERHLRRALEVRPGLMVAKQRYTTFLREVGRLKAAWEVADRTATDPRATSILIQLAFLEAQFGMLDRAYRVSDRLEALRPQFRDIRVVIVQWWENRKTMRRLEASARNAPCFEAHFASMEAAKGAPVIGLPKVCSDMDVIWSARMLARQGDIEGAYDLVARPHAGERTWWFLFYPEMKAFRRDPRFMPLAAKLGLLRYWRETNQWPDFCYEPDLPYDCRQTQTAMPIERPTR